LRSKVNETQSKEAKRKQKRVILY